MSDKPARDRLACLQPWGWTEEELNVRLNAFAAEEREGARRLSADGIRRVAAARGWQDWAADYIHPDIDFDKEAVEVEHRAREAVIRAGATAAVRALHHPVTLEGMACCNECSTQRRTGPHAAERIALIPHPCRTIQALNGEAT